MSVNQQPVLGRRVALLSPRWRGRGGGRREPGRADRQGDQDEGRQPGGVGVPAGQAAQVVERRQAHAPSRAGSSSAPSSPSSTNTASSPHAKVDHRGSRPKSRTVSATQTSTAGAVASAAGSRSPTPVLLTAPADEPGADPHDDEQPQRAEGGDDARGCRASCHRLTGVASTTSARPALSSERSRSAVAMP